MSEVSGEENRSNGDAGGGDASSSAGWIKLLKPDEIRDGSVKLVACGHRTLCAVRCEGRSRHSTTSARIRTAHLERGRSKTAASLSLAWLGFRSHHGALARRIR